MINMELERDLKEWTWEVKYVQKAKNMCVVDGWYDINWNLMFEPYKNMSRQEVSNVIYNMIKLK